jgi:hypothetical protein
MRPITLRADSAAALLDVPVSTLRKHGPKPVRLGRHDVWRVSDLENWVGGIADGMAAGDDAAEEARALAALQRP